MFHFQTKTFPGDQTSGDLVREGKYIPPARRQNSNSSGRDSRENRNAGSHRNVQGSGTSPPLQHQQRRHDRDFNTPPSNSPSSTSSHSGKYTFFTFYPWTGPLTQIFPKTSSIPHYKGYILCASKLLIDLETSDFFLYFNR